LTSNQNIYSKFDTSDLPLRIGNWGQVMVSDPLGNLTQRNFTISGNMIFLPQVSK
jgi:hypothetical protein